MMRPRKSGYEILCERGLRYTRFDGQQILFGLVVSGCIRFLVIGKGLILHTAPMGSKKVSSNWIGLLYPNEECLRNRL